MSPTDAKSHGAQPPPASHPLPQRTSPENLVTLQHQQLARDASLRASRGSVPPNRSNAASSSRRDSSGESRATGQSDAKKWFDQSNQNPTATFDSNVMDVDPPFFQKESDSSNEDKPFPYEHRMPPPKRTAAHSSSADDYRSVIDDLTVEIQKLKEELKRYKQRGPDMLRKEKLFEIKIHGLPKRKRRELESTLRDFAAGLGDSPDAAASSPRKKSSREANRDRMYSGSGSMSMSKHASSSSGSNIRPLDSAYASMSTGANSSGTSLVQQHAGSRAKSSEQKVESYLRDIPEGLYPRHMAMTERDKKRLVVRRLEQVFTGKIAGRHARRSQETRPLSAGPVPSTAPIAQVHQSLQPSAAQQSSVAPEPAREARILPHEHHSGQSEKKSRSQDMGSASNSHGDRTESGGNGNGPGPDTNPSPSMPAPPEQRPTRPKDLDPDRVQIPSENMEYIKHLGLVPPELARTPSHYFIDDVHPDAEGWVYLNLLCNMAQLHIMNVTPDFVRNAVTDFSAKFQLSPDGRKIRWRGGTEGTKFSSDSSGGNSQRSPQTDDTENSTKDGPCKRQKTGRSTDDGFQSSGKNMSKFGPQVSGSSSGFHYKPLFVHQGSPNEQLSMEKDTLSSVGPVEDSNGDSRWGQSGSGASNRRKRRRHDGAIIYYSGAPFCTDLSGDPGSPATYMLSSGQEVVDPPGQFARPPPMRSESGSSLNRLPLSDKDLCIGSKSNMEVDGSEDSDDDCSEVNLEFPWCNEKQYIEVRPLEPCGLGGVLPEDHFMVVVTTRRPKDDADLGRQERVQRSRSEEATENIINRLATMSTSPRSFMPPPSLSRPSHGVEIEYVSGRIKRLMPVPLPPPAIFFPPFSTDSWSDDVFESEGDDEFHSSEKFMSRRANPHQSDDYPDGVDLSSGDEDGDDPDDEPDMPSDE